MEGAAADKLSCPFLGAHALRPTEHQLKTWIAWGTPARGEPAALALRRDVRCQLARRSLRERLLEVAEEGRDARTEQAARGIKRP
jgi:hypothetical protein